MSSQNSESKNYPYGGGGGGGGGGSGDIYLSRESEMTTLNPWLEDQGKTNSILEQNPFISNPELYSPDHQNQTFRDSFVPLSQNKSALHLSLNFDESEFSTSALGGKYDVLGETTRFPTYNPHDVILNIPTKVMSSPQLPSPSAVESESFWDRFRSKFHRSPQIAKGGMLSSPSSLRFSRITRDQKSTLIIMFCQLLIALLCWNLSTVGTYILYPFQLISVLFHELGHAIMAWLTGGSVVSIRVGPKADGLTKYYGGINCLVLPAGYLGSSLVGAVMLFCGFNSKSALYLSYCIDAILIFILFFSEGVFTILMTLFTLALFLALAYYGRQPVKVQGGGNFVATWDRRNYLRYCILFMGVIAAFVSCFDILDDLIFRNVPDSDGYKFAYECLLFAPPLLVGLFWLIFSGIFIVLAVYLAIRFFPIANSN